MPVKSLQPIGRIAFRVGGVLIVIVAVTLSAARVLLPQAKNHKEFWEVELTTWIGKPVRIENISARMVGMSPVLVVNGAQILSSDEQRVLLNARQIRLALDTQKLIGRGKLQPRWLSVVGARLKARRKVNGALTLVGLKSSNEFPHWLFEKGPFELVDSTIEWQDRRRQIRDLKLTGVDIRIVNQGIWHSLSVSLALPDGLGGDVDIVARYRGDTAEADCCTGRFHANLVNIDFGKLVVRPPVGDFKPGSGSEGRFRVWGEIADSRLKNLSGWFKFANLSIYRGTSDKSKSLPSAPFKNLDGWFDWHSLNKGWSLGLRDFSLTLDNKPWPRSDLDIVVETGEAADRFTLKSAASFLRIEDIRRFALESIPLKTKLRSALAHLKPSGEVHDLEVTYATADQGANTVSACGKFNHLNFNAWGKLPGINNLGGRFCGDSDGGELEMLSKTGQFVAPGLFRRALPIRSINGKMRWMQSRRAWHFVSQRLVLNTPDINTHSRIHVTVPKGAKAPFIDLQTGFSDGIAAHAGTYLPTKIMRESVVEWLDAAFISGRVGRGGVLVFGPLDRFPYGQADGVFEALFDVEGMELAYKSEWPHMTELAAKVRFERKSLTIQSERGKLSGADMENVVITIDDLVKGDHLRARGKARGKVSQTLEFLHNSPLHSRADPIIEFVELEGENQIETDLMIPLKPTDDAQVQGTVQVRGGKLKVVAADLQFEEINGELTFDNDGLAARAVDARLFGIPSQINIRREKAGALVRVATKLDERLRARYLSEPMRSAISGESDLTTKVWIPNPKDGHLSSTRIVFESDLLGTQLAFPEPLGKTGNSRRNLTVQLSLTDKKQIPLDLHYADTVSARLRFSEPSTDTVKFEGGELIVGNSPFRRPPRAGLGVVCRLDRLQLAPWFAWVAKSGKGKAGFPVDVREFDVDVGALNWKATDLGNMSVDLRRDGTDWIGKIDSHLGKGTVRFPVTGKDAHVLSMDLEYLRVPNFNGAALKAGEKLAVAPDLLSGLRVNSDQLQWRSADLGALHLRTQSLPAILKIKKFALESKQHKLNLSGNWRYSRQRDWSEVRGTFKSEDLGDFFDQIDLSHSIKDSPAEVVFRLNWNDKLHRFAPETLDGKVNMEFGKGRLLDVEPGIGRALGALNPSTLLRRLRLDFRDLYEEGFAYDSAKASYKISNGDAITEDLIMDAVSSRILAVGRIGLVERDFDQLITVIPKASAGLPIAGAIAGGPAVGAAVFVAQKLIGDRVDSMTSTQYALTGSWDDPVVTNLPGNGGILQKAWSGFKDITWPEINETTKNENTK